MSPRILRFIAEWLPRNAIRMRRLRLRWLEGWLRQKYDANTEPFPMRLHGFPIRLNGGNPYPFLLAENPFFNQPLAELVRQVSNVHGRQLVIIDVGASLGNTVLLLQEQAAPTIARIHCIEADHEFIKLLIENTEQFPNVVLHQAMLAAEAKDVRSLVHHHPGSATAVGAHNVRATTIDELLLLHASRFDILKIDIDGSDGEALAGAQKMLKRDQPAVIFEWHPALIHQTGNDPYKPFSVLSDAGYTRFLWFRNTGHFSHFSRPGDPEVETWMHYLRAMQPNADPHFDIVALPTTLDSLGPKLASLGVLA